MHNLSMAQALSIWSDLCDAYHGENGYGGDTAEIYIYRLKRDDPAANGMVYGGVSSGLARDAEAERVAIANVSLFSVLKHFEMKRAARVEVNGREIGPWILTAMFDHRVHVRVTKL